MAAGSKTIAVGDIFCKVWLLRQNWKDLNNSLNVWWKLYLKKSAYSVFLLLWFFTDKVLTFLYISCVNCLCWLITDFSWRTWVWNLGDLNNFLNSLKKQISKIGEMPFVKNYRLKTWKTEFLGKLQQFLFTEGLFCTLRLLLQILNYLNNSFTFWSQVYLKKRSFRLIVYLPTKLKTSFLRVAGSKIIAL